MSGAPSSGRRERGALARRIPATDAPNAWARALERRRSAGAAPIDLAAANPTAVGLAGSAAPLASVLASSDAGSYAPDPRGLAVARGAIARVYTERGIALSPDRVVLASGTSEAYAHLFRLLCDPGDTVLIPQPSYPLFEPIATLEGVAVAGYRLEWEGRWRLDLESVERAATENARAVIVVQPNHPTGSCLDPAERGALESLCRERGLAIVSDEVFGEFGWERAAAAPGVAPPPGARALPSLLDRPQVLTFALGGLSKSCGLPQLKLSWIAVGGPPDAAAEALRGLEWIADLFLSVATPVQLALPALLAGRFDYQARVHRRIDANRATLAATIGRRPELRALDGDGGWVAVLQMPKRHTDEQWALALLDRDVVVHPGHFYDFDDPWHLVISLIVPPEAFAEGMRRLEQTLEA
jgi:aspartate/methionine/tyrosine aminotransferase